MSAERRNPMSAWGDHGKYEGRDADSLTYGGGYLRARFRIIIARGGTIEPEGHGTEVTGDAGADGGGDV